MNIRTKLESKEGQWIRVHFPDSSYITGRLSSVGSDYLQLECFGRDEANKNDCTAYSQHLIPIPLVKFITLEAPSFVEAERKRLEYINSSFQDAPAGNIPDMEK